MKEVSVELYPNPAKDRVRIDSKVRVRNLQISTLNGEIVGQREVDGHFLDLPLKGFAQGVYFIRLVTDEGVITKKLVIE